MLTMTTSQELLNQAAERMAQHVTDVFGAPTAEARAQAALAAHNYNRATFAPAIAAERRQAVRELRAMGWSLKECAELLGVTDSRIAQITGG